MKVYILQVDQDLHSQAWVVIGAFSTLEKANRAKANAVLHGYGEAGLDIEEMQIDYDQSTNTLLI